MRRSFTLALTALALVLFAAPAALADQPLDQPLDLDQPQIQMTPMDAQPAALENEAQEPLFVQEAPVTQCGNRVCPPGTYCCNASCGICLPPDQVCIQIVCDNPGDIRH